ncbi:MFS transporter [Heliorestis convoluta]|uniref:Major facilitator superfamily protein n=1 Tax=Heliorestis convoluta TaxID=356322 RepID=A0A5Q2N1E7_9FIRM|nr:MFS transporter [Heliorestis convoluta]QGG46190.1 major facilitator superfamily protein [Heliorestis convoluta]
MPTENKTSIWTKSFIYICLVNFLIFGALQVILPTLPVYVKELGGDASQVGLIIGLFTVTAMLSRPFSGFIIDKWGRRSLLVIGLVLYAFLSYSYILAYSVLMLLLIRLLHGVVWGATTTATGTVATDLLPSVRLGEGMGYFGLTSALSMATFPALGLFIIEQYDFFTLFILAMALGIVGAFIALLIEYKEPTSNELLLKQKAPTQEKEIGQKKKVERKEIKKKLQNLFEPQAYKPSIVMFFITTTFGAIISFIALYADELAIGQVGLFFSFYALTLIAGRPFAGRQIDQGRIHGIVGAGLVALLVSLILLAQANSITTFMLSGSIYGVGMAFTMPALQTLSVQGVPYHRRGAANGTFFTFFDLGLGLGAIGWGFVALFIGYRWMYALSSLPVILAGLVYFIKKEKEVSPVDR